jgi:large repetitive protein
VNGTQDVTLHNTILAGNTSTNTTYHDVWGTLQSASSHNIIGQIGASGLSNGVNANKVGTTSAHIDPKLAPLADNGGPTWTHSLLPYSPAIDGGSNEQVDVYGLDYDQRRQSRVRDGNLDGLLVADIGAYEVDADEFFASVGA